MKKVVLLTFVFFLLLTIKSQEKRGENKRVIPIVGWYGIPQDGSIQNFADQKKSGIEYNLVYYNTNLEQIIKALDVAHKGGIKIILGNTLLKTDTEKFVRLVKDHPALAGYSLQDEPSVNEFDSLSALVKRVQSIDSNHFCYINLLPNYAKDTAFGESYEAYIETFLKKVPTLFLSFDNYPIYRDSKSDKLLLRSDWYQNLEIVSKLTRKRQKPFWAFALTTAHSNYPVPDIEQIRLQVYSNLAYGAQGIQYFTYWTPSGQPQMGFREGPVFNGKLTNIYEIVKTINKEIINLSEVFLNAKVQFVYHTGSEIPIGTTRLTQLPSGIKVLDTDGCGAVVSLLKKDRYFFLVVVNRDLKKTMKLSIQGKKALTRILKDGNKSLIGLKADSQDVDPGGIEVYRWR